MPAPLLITCTAIGTLTEPTGRAATLLPIAARASFQFSWLRSFRYCSKSVTWRVEQRAPLSMNSFLFANSLPRQLKAGP